MALPVHPARRLAERYVWYRLGAHAQPREGDVTTARSLGFELLGCLTEGVFPQYRKQVFVDRSRTTQVQLSQRGYFFITYFEGGRCILTWDHNPQTQSTAMLESRATAGSFQADYEAHVAAVNEASKTDIPITVPNLETALALGRIYYRQLVPVPLAVNMLLVPPFFIMVTVVAVLMLLRRCSGKT
jgi:hypothetical protein